MIAAGGFADPRTDYEAELAVIIGRRCRDVKPEAALAYVFGYSCFNDVSQRDIQNGDRAGWFRGKSFDGFGPIGPAIAPVGLDPRPAAPRHPLPPERPHVVQDSSTAAMIFSVAELVSYISRNLTLESGDIIATGTPKRSRTHRPRGPRRGGDRGHRHPLQPRDRGLGPGDRQVDGRRKPERSHGGGGPIRP